MLWWKIRGFIEYIKKGIRIVFSNIFARISFAYNSVQYKKMPRVSGMILISVSRPKSIFFGENVIINSGRICNPVGFESKVELSTLRNGEIHIGNHVGMSNAVICSMERIELQNDVMLGNGVKIYDTDFHSKDFYERNQYSREEPIKTAAVLIKEGVFIGAGSLILKGVTIGKHSIVAANSTVTKSIPDNEIWGGSPAKFIRSLVD